MKILNQKIWNSLTEEMRETVRDIENQMKYNEYLLTFNDDTDSGIDYPFEDLLYHHNVQYAAGASKVCMWDEGNYVVKAPLLYSLYYNYDDCECDDEVEPSYDAQGDYIAEDMRVYDNYPCKSLLAKTYKLVELDYMADDNYCKRIPVIIYAQDRCISADNDGMGFDDWDNYVSPKAKNSIENKFYKKTYFDKRWMNEFYAVYGDDIAEEFFENYSSNDRTNKYWLNDMCGRNYGYSADGLHIPMIYDYSGFGNL